MTVYLVRPGDDQVVGWLTELVGPLLERLLGVPVSTLRTEPSDNDFPALPVRAGENAFVWLAAFDDAQQHGRCDGTGAVGPGLDRQRAAPAGRAAPRPAGAAAGTDRDVRVPLTQPALSTVIVSTVIEPSLAFTSMCRTAPGSVGTDTSWWPSLTSEVTR